MVDAPPAWLRKVQERQRLLARADPSLHAASTKDWPTIDLTAEPPPDDKGKLN